jgi:hypothetical protein
MSAGTRLNAAVAGHDALECAVVFVLLRNFEDSRYSFVHDKAWRRCGRFGLSLLKLRGI